MCSKMFIFKIQLFLSLMLIPLTAASDISITRSSETIYLSKNNANVPVQVELIDLVSNTSLISNFIARNQTLIIPGKPSDYALRVLPSKTIREIDVRNRGAKDIASRTKAKRDTANLREAEFRFEITDRNESIEIYLFPKNKLNKYNQSKTLFSMGTGDYVNKKLDIIYFWPGYFSARGIKKFKQYGNQENVKKGDLEERLLKLKQLLEKGLINESIYAKETERLVMENL
jgi:hypothetical protein